MKISIFVLCNLLASGTILTAQTQPGTTLSNAELFSRQYAQADTTIQKNPTDSCNYSFKVNDNKCMPQGRLKTIGSGYVGMTVGAMAFGTIGYGVGSALELDPGAEFYGLATAAFTGIGLLTGGSLGCSYGVHHTGSKYRKGSFWVALGATFFHNMIAGQIAKDLLAKDLYSSKRSATLAALPYALAPLSATAAYYIFSEDSPDTIKAP